MFTYYLDAILNYRHMKYITAVALVLVVGMAIFSYQKGDKISELESTISNQSQKITSLEREKSELESDMEKLNQVIKTFQERYLTCQYGTIK